MKLAVTAALPGQRTATTPTPSPTPVTNGIIHDVDNDSDGGDVLNTLMAINGGHLHRNVSTLLAVISTSANDYSAPMLRAQLDYFGYTAVPVGAVIDTTGTPNSFSGTNGRSYVNANSADPRNFTQTVRDQFRAGDTRTNYTAEVATYKTALAQCADGTCKVVISGGFTSMARLLADAAGKALLAAKCSGIYIMGGRFDGTPSFSEANINTDIAAAQYFIANVPTTIPIVWAGYEIGTSVVNYPPYDLGNTITDDPSLRGFLQYTNNVYNPIACWDHIATYYALYGLGTDPVNGGALFSLSAPQDVSFNGSGYTTVTPNASGQHRYLSLVAPTSIIQATFQQELYQAFNRRSAAWLAQEALVAGTGYRGLYQFYGKLDAGSGQVVADSSGLGNNGTLGQTSSSASDDPTWIAQGLQFDGVNDLVSVPSSSGFNCFHVFMWAIVSISATGAIQIFGARDDGSANRQFHFRVNASNQPEFIAFSGITVTGAGLTMTAGNWYLLSAEIFDQIIILRKGTTVLQATNTALGNNHLTSVTTPLTLGVRGTGTNPLNGKIAAFGLMRKPPQDKIANIIADATALATSKGITLS